MVIAKVLMLGHGAGKRLGESERSQLQSNSGWVDSRFSVLEGFISAYLAGGASAGEGVRLKLQTPLFVSEALLDTAQKQLSDLLATAEEVSHATASAHATHAQCLAKAYEYT